jgi:colanic acid/amylovoran biosynthesis protein WcaK/AmsJ
VRVVITNTVSLNAGDAAILCGLIGSVRDAFGEDAEISVFDSHAEVARRLHPGIEFRPQLYSLFTRTTRISRRLPRRWNERRVLAASAAGPSAHVLLSGREKEALLPWQSADLIVSTGGTYLVEQYDLSARIFDFNLARRLAKPLVLFTQSIGPFRDSSLRRRLAAALRDARLVLVRDNESRESALDLGLSRESVYVVADAAFALGDIGRLSGVRERRLPLQGAKIAISVREWPYFHTKTRDAGMRDYSAAVGMLVGHLLAKGHEVTFLSTCQGVPEYWTDDSVTARRILAAAGGVRDRVAVDSAFHTPTELLTKLGTFDAVVATRMHAAILALSAGTPVLAIDYEDKARRLFGNLGVPDWSVDIESVSPSVLCQAWDAFAERVDARRSTLIDAVSVQMLDARRAADLLRRTVA